MVPPWMVPTDMPAMEPVDTVPVEVMVLIVVLLITPEPVVLSSGALNDPDNVPMLTLLVMPCPAAVMEPVFVPTDMPEMEPVDTVPVEVMVLMVVLLITPEPVVLSSGALNDPDNVPMLTLLVVPWPAAWMAAPRVTSLTFMPTIEPANTRPEIVPKVV